MAGVSSATPNALPVSPNPQERGLFGYSVAMSGDLVVVGAMGESVDGLCGGGHAYVFNSGDGALVYTLTSHNPLLGAQFGESVATNGKVVLVGADGEPAGSVYVFNATTGTFLYKLTNPDPRSELLFGSSVAVSGDLALVGAPGNNATGRGFEGSVYVYNVSDGSLVRTLTSPHPQKAGNFGFSIGIGGDEAIVGAPSENSGRPVAADNSSKGFTSMGYVYIFNASTGAVISTLAGPNGPGLGFGNLDFGNSVAVSGNLALIGTLDGGRAFVYNSSGGLLRTLREPNPTENGFNGGVAIARDILVVGAYGESAAGDGGAGNAYVFNATTGALIRTLSSPNPQSFGDFGWSVATNGKYVVVGAHGESAKGYAHAGNAYLFNKTQL